MKDSFIFFALILLLLTGGMMFVAPEWGTALIVAVMMSAIAIFVVRKFTDEADFVTRVFLIALLLRLAFGVLVHVFDLRRFFGGDAVTYDSAGRG